MQVMVALVALVRESVVHERQLQTSLLQPSLGSAY